MIRGRITRGQLSELGFIGLIGLQDFMPITCESAAPDSSLFLRHAKKVGSAGADNR